MYSRGFSDARSVYARMLSVPLFVYEPPAEERWNRRKGVFTSLFSVSATSSSFYQEGYHTSSKKCFQERTFF